MLVVLVRDSLAVLGLLATRVLLQRAARDAEVGEERQVRDGVALIGGRDVGVGAQWMVLEERQVYGFKLKQRKTYTVKKIEGDVVHLEFVCKQNVHKGEVAALPVPGGDVFLKVKSLDLNSKGEIVIDLSRPIPLMLDLSGGGTMESDFVMDKAAEKGLRQDRNFQFRYSVVE